MGTELDRRDYYQVAIRNGPFQDSVLQIPVDYCASVSLLGEMVAEELSDAYPTAYTEVDGSSLQLMFDGIVLNPCQVLPSQAHGRVEVEVLPHSASDLLALVHERVVSRILCDLAKRELEEDGRQWKGTIAFRHIVLSVIALQCRSPPSMALQPLFQRWATSGKGSTLALIQRQLHDFLSIKIKVVQAEPNQNEVLDEAIEIENLEETSPAGVIRERVAIMLGRLHPSHVRLTTRSGVEVDYLESLSEDLRRSLVAQVLSPSADASMPDLGAPDDQDLMNLRDSLRDRRLHPGDIHRTWGSTSAFAEIFRCLETLISAS